MEVTDVEYIEDEGHPLLKCTIDGISALIGADQSISLVRAGVVHIGQHFKDYVVQPEELPENLRSHFDKPLIGCTNDPEFLARVFLPWMKHLRSGA